MTAGRLGDGDLYVWASTVPLTIVLWRRRKTCGQNHASDLIHLIYFDLCLNILRIFLTGCGFSRVWVTFQYKKIGEAEKYIWRELWILVCLCKAHILFIVCIIQWCFIPRAYKLLWHQLIIKVHFPWIHFTTQIHGITSQKTSSPN